MSSVFDCRDADQLLTGMRHARQAIGRGELIVLPTDTVYGVGADAFDPAAVQRLLDAKGRGRNQPPPVLIGNAATLSALVESVPEPVQRLVDEFWPGGLTIVLPAQPSLVWDLGDTHGTVAVRMPEMRVALELLEETGPLAVSSANLTGQDAAVEVGAAERMLGDSVAVYLDNGPSATGVASTIVDATSLVRPGGEDAKVRVLRDGAVSRDELRRVLGDLLEEPATPGAAVPADLQAASEQPTDAEAPEMSGTSASSPATPEPSATPDEPEGPA
ncbi:MULTISPECIES: L-threonylcarbamoyladenylate synthase [Bacteria]|uniref:L-threonylcarbamoyladenylate synthase n=1 Tax=Bacteria TaxID=2 RepID=UPI003C7B4DC9